MDVILLERIEKLGKMGDVVAVKPGYARNYLLPQNKALRATAPNRALFESRRAELEAQNAERRGLASTLGAEIDGTSIVLVRQSSDSGQLYGSVRPRDIAQCLRDLGWQINRTQVWLTEPIKTIGIHPVRVAVHPEVIVEVTANVARSEEEARLQAEGKSVLRQDLFADQEEADEGFADESEAFAGADEAGPGEEAAAAAEGAEGAQSSDQEEGGEAR